MRTLVSAVCLAVLVTLTGCSPAERGMLGLTLDESGRLAAVVWPCSRDFPIRLSAFQSTDHDFIATPNPTNRDEIFGASIHLSTHDGGDRPWLVPILDPPHGWEVDFDNVQDNSVRPDMRWQVGGEAVDNTSVKYRLPDARQPDGTPIPEWPDVIAAYDHGMVTVEEFEQLGKKNC